ncbi:cytochrome p450 monooxygenase [Fusarium heterosporum]|uniref:Cytochrome p450 monooxygenase n=1 Tax=Fusarium heterosporum TaxID=42747 RepID=A0A8H5SWE6_FUSHE|nr:cytochrome p450 monooxygenase [Fusarium heterosporum]
MLETSLPTIQSPSKASLMLLFLLVIYEALKVIYRLTFHRLSKIPGPWLPASSSVWIRWQRWHGRLSFKIDTLLTTYGPIVRIAPNIVLVNDIETVQSIFIRQDLDTAPTAIRALRIGGHDWTVTYPSNPLAKERRRPVMMASTTKSMRYWQPTFETNISKMIEQLGESQGKNSEDIVHHLRIATLLNSLIVMGGSQVVVEPGDFPHIVGEYNFLVVWRLCLPEWLFEWLKYSPFREAAFRVKSSDALFDLGNKVIKAAETGKGDDQLPTIYDLLVESMSKGPFGNNQTELSAEMAGQVLAATETTSSALAFIFYYLSQDPLTVEAIYEELKSVNGYEKLEGLKMLNACITEGLRFRPPVALTGSRVAPKGGLNVLGYYIPEGTVITTQSLSISRQRPDLFPNFDEFDPSRWLEEDPAIITERRRCLAPFGIGARRCPGNNMAIFQMRMLLAAIIRAFRLSVAPMTTPISMAPFEANGFRSRYDKCELVFTPRDLDPQPGPRGCECGPTSM